MRRGGWYTVAAVLIGVAVTLAGGALVGDAGRAGIRSGAAIGAAAQVAGFWILSVWALPRKPVLAHGVGMLVRLVVVGLVALVWVPRSGLPAAPTLFSLVAVLFLTMLVEPMALKIGGPQRTGSAGAASQ